jgi:hypothetical protein
MKRLEQQEVNPLGAEVFPEQWKQPFEGLLYLGYLRKEVTKIPFHHFVIRTLTVNDKLEINLATKDYQDTVGYGRAYRAAVVAAGLESVDGRELIPASKGTNTFRQKFEYVINSWYDGVIDTLFAEIDELEGQVFKVLQEIGILPKAAEETPIFKDEKGASDTPKGGK